MGQASKYIMFQNIGNRDLPAQQSNGLVSFGQQDAFFHLAALKNGRSNSLKAWFADKPLTRVILSANLNGFGCRIPGCTVEYLDSGFFVELDEAVRAKKREHLEGAIVVVNNNDVGQATEAFADFYTSCNKTIFVAWDWDNHHWLDLSTFLAAHTDLYAPAHHENLYLLTRYNWVTVGPVYCGTVQWSRSFLTDNIAKLVTTNRSNEPLGMHIPYAPFTYRNRVVTTLSQHYPTIGFSGRNFHNRTKEERLEEWCSHKVHWIAPVLNDVAIRIFDALSTGGIPVVPASMQFLPPIASISREHIVFSTPDDIMNPKPLIERAVAMFDSGGADGIVARHRYALDHHHGDQRMADVMAFVRERFGA
jgi:hypothetical protein